MFSVFLGLALIAPSAQGDTPSHPPDNIPMGELPQRCSNDGASVECENAVIYYLNRARSQMGLPPYLLPADFTQLGPDRQMFILANLDRVAYDLTPADGLNETLSADAKQGAVAGDHPWPTDFGFGHNGFGSNWAAGFDNALIAYYFWMYDDGWGSVNATCASPTDSGCWGHRDNFLRVFSTSGYEAAMGLAAAPNKEWGTGYGMLIVGASPAFSPEPPYYYAWTDATADGAGSNHYDPGIPDLSEPGDDAGGRTWLSLIHVKGPSVIAKGRTAKYKVRALNGGSRRAENVHVDTKGAGYRSRKDQGALSAGQWMSATILVRPRRRGRVAITFTITSANAISRVVKKMVTVK